MRTLVFSIMTTIIGATSASADMDYCKMPFGFAYESAIPDDDGADWMEDTVWHFEYTERSRSILFEGEPITITVFVTPVTEDMSEADLINLEEIPEGIVFGNEYVSFDQVEALLQQTMCP